MTFRLTREVRFALSDRQVDQFMRPPTNSFAGYPSVAEFDDRFLSLQVTVSGSLSPQSSYLLNIKDIDRAVRERIVASRATGGIAEIFNRLADAWPDHPVKSVRLRLTPFLSLTQLASEHPMLTRLSQKFEFSAAHRLHNPNLSDDENRRIYGKCNNPNGHGHNYEVEVTLRGKQRADGLLVDVPAFEMIVQETVIQRFDHKHLNLDVPEFRELIPTVENISMVVHRLLKDRFKTIGVELASVTVWETPKTWCEYSEI